MFKPVLRLAPAVAAGLVSACGYFPGELVGRARALLDGNHKPITVEAGALFGRDANIICIVFAEFDALVTRVPLRPSIRAEIAKPRKSDLINRVVVFNADDEVVSDEEYHYQNRDLAFRELSEATTGMFASHVKSH